MSTVVQLAQLDTEYNADSIEWCHFGGYEDIVSCGTYELEEGKESDESRRIGLLHLYQVESSGETHDVKIEKLQSVKTSGLLDMKWLSVRRFPVLLATAVASGHVDLYTVKEDEDLSKLSLQKLGSHPVTDSLCLSLDSSSSDCGVRLVVSNSPGTVAVLNDTESELKTTVSWKAHDFEAWIATWDRWNQNTVFTGGDDCKLKFWDLRSLDRPHHICKRHTMGVCSVSSHPSQPHILATGSYDEMVCVWDTRNMRRSLCEVGVGGGVWRLKWHPSDKRLLLAACMHNGCNVLSCQTELGSITTVVSYQEHKSLLYGIDWGYTNLKGNHQSVIASCSFYDRKFHIWCYR